MAHKPWRNKEAEAMLNNQTATTENFQTVAEKIFAEAKGFGHNTFKIELGKRTVVHALRQAVEMKRTNDSQFQRTSTKPI